MPTGIVRGHEQPAQARVGVIGADLTHLQRAAEPLHDFDPVAQEEEQQHDRRGEVRGHEEGQEVLVVLVDVPAEQARQHDAVAEARDRERLGDALCEAEDDRLEVGDRVHRRASLWVGPPGCARVTRAARQRRPGLALAPDTLHAMAAGEAPTEPSLREVAREWGRIGCVGFGGPPAHIALFRELCVTQRAWLTDEEFERAIAATNLLPGPASTQLAIYCAWRLRGRAGALLGGRLLHPARPGDDPRAVGALPVGLATGVAARRRQLARVPRWPLSPFTRASAWHARSGGVPSTRCGPG